MLPGTKAALKPCAAASSIYFNVQHLIPFLRSVFQTPPLSASAPLLTLAALLLLAGTSGCASRYSGSNNKTSDNALTQFAARFEKKPLPYTQTLPVARKAHSQFQRLSKDENASFLQTFLEQDCGEYYARHEAKYAPIFALARPIDVPDFVALVYSFQLGHEEQVYLATFARDGSPINRIHLAGTPTTRNRASFTTGRIESDWTVSVRHNRPIQSTQDQPRPGDERYRIWPDGSIARIDSAVGAYVANTVTNVPPRTNTAKP